MARGRWRRVIQEHIKKPLAEELLFGKLVKGGSVKVTMKDGKLDFEIIEAALPALPKPDERWRRRFRQGAGSRGLADRLIGAVRLPVINRGRVVQPRSCVFVPGFQEEIWNTDKQG